MCVLLAAFSENGIYFFQVSLYNKKDWFPAFRYAGLNTVRPAGKRRIFVQMDQTVTYDAWDEAYKTPFGAVPEGAEIGIHLRVSAKAGARGAVLKLRRDGEAQEREVVLKGAPTDHDIIFSGAFSVAEKGLWFYRFEISTAAGLLFVGRGENAQAVTGDFLPEWQLTVYDPAFTTPEGLGQGILYQIFPDRFRKGRSGEVPPARNRRTLHADWLKRPLFKADEPDYAATDFFGGDLEGIREKLPYLKSLGVTMLYLNPVFEAASNHRYNTGDYFSIDPWLGTEADFARLCREAEKLGIRVILDGVFSHTGSDSRYFNRDGHYDTLGAWQSPDSPYAAWYRFKDPSRREYDCWWGIPTLPNVNEEEPSFQEFICGEGGVLDYWMERGASGWRLDVADELPDGFLDAVRRRVKARSRQAYLLGEVWEDASNKESYGQRRRYLLGSQLDGVMNYPWRDALLDFIREGDAGLFYSRIMELLDHYPAPAVQALMNPLSTHDVARAATVLGVLRQVPEPDQGEYCMTPEEQKRGRRRLMLAALLQYTLPGFPSLYYGDEAGMSGFSDPWNRRCYPWGSEDGDLLRFFQSLGTVRSENSRELRESLHFVSASGGLVAYRRGRLLAAVNRAPDPKRIFTGGTFLLAAGEAVLDGGVLTLQPDSGAILME